MGKDHSITKYYAVNHDSTCIFVTTTKDETKISQQVLDVFAQASVLFSAISTGIGKAGKKLFDFDAYYNVLSQDDNFTAMALEKKTFTHTAKSLSLNLSIIEEVVGSEAMGGPAELALTSVLGSIGNELNASTATDTSVTKIAKAMLWVEEIMGVPDVSVQLWYIDRSESTKVTHTNCSDTTSSSISFDYNMQEFNFIDPTWIAQFSDAFKTDPAYTALVNKMEGYAKNPPH